jgi:hypothetical protein
MRGDEVTCACAGWGVSTKANKDIREIEYTLVEEDGLYPWTKNIWMTDRYWEECREKGCCSSFQEMRGRCIAFVIKGWGNK